MQQARRKKPTLYVFAMCEKALSEESNVLSLIRIVDIFTFPFPRGQGLKRNEATILNATLVTRWGDALGNFTEELRLRSPKNRRIPPVGRPVQFNLPSPNRFLQIRHDIRLAIRAPGFYSWRLYLDGRLVAQLPFEVRFTEETEVTVLEPVPENQQSPSGP